MYKAQAPTLLGWSSAEAGTRSPGGAGERGEELRGRKRAEVLRSGEPLASRRPGGPPQGGAQVLLASLLEDTQTSHADLVCLCAACGAPPPPLFSVQQREAAREEGRLGAEPL